MISEFRGNFRFLSNFYLCDIVHDGEFYPSVEHAFQAAKCEILSEHELFKGNLTAAEAKRLGRQVKIRNDWEQVKLAIMEELLRDKFKFKARRWMLENTKPHELVEGNNWGDRYWGKVNGVGENHLGKLLMKIRDE